MLLGFPQIFSAKAPHTEACCRVQLDRIGWQCLLSASEHPQAHWTLFLPSFSYSCRLRVFVDTLETHTHTHTHTLSLSLSLSLSSFLPI